MPRLLPDAVHARIVERAAAGQSASVIGAALGLTKGSVIGVIYRARRRGAPLKARIPGEPFAHEDLERIADRYAEGLSPKEVCGEMGETFTLRRVHRALNRLRKAGDPRARPHHAKPPRPKQARKPRPPRQAQPPRKNRGRSNRVASDGLAVPGMLRLPLEELWAVQCRYPLWADRTEPRHYCGLEAGGRHPSWCDEHYDIVTGGRE